MTDTLFPTLDQPPIPAPTPEAGPFAGIALEQSIDRVLDYAIGPKLLTSIHVGQRVRVPLGRGNKPAHGYVVSIQPTTAHPKVKRILSIEDDRVLVTPELMELARWMSRYYITPLGIVLDSVIPSAVKKRIGIGYSQMVRLAWTPEKIQELLEKTKARKRRAILARLLQLPADQSIELIRLAGEAGVTPPTVRKLAVGGLITIRPEVDLPRLTEDMPVGRADETDIALNSDQQKVFDALLPRLAGGFSINLIHGVTGSGKTEVYLQSIREIISRNKQALVLVPEIALTPQTVHRFMARFPRVAILHSGLTATQRHKYWQQITQGQADVVVGARSAVFAPLPNLGIIVVDEEHDSSYKQDQAPRYNGRDVAIKRAQLEDIPVILGSATPSLESYYRATTAAQKSPTENRYPLYELPNRVRGLAMPAVELVDMRTDQRHRRGVHLISVRLEHLLKVTLESKRQAILLLNRRGYSNFVYCASCSEPIHCKYCDTTMTYHRSAEAHAHGASSAEGIHTGQLHCHYCLAVNPLPDKCATCGKKLILFGLGTQRVEEEFARKFPECKFARVDSDSMRSSKDYEQLLTQRFARNEVQVMLGTQMIAKGLDYPNVTLVGVISGDTALSLPDFRAAERTFQLITQVAGRAGRGDSPGRVIVQTFMPDDPTIRAALKHDYAGFAASELKNRQQCALPPFSRMVRIILRDEDSAQLTLHSQELATLLESAVQAANVPVKTRGPMPCPINRIAGYFRNQIILTAPTPEPLQQILATVRNSGGLAKSDRIAVDVDPVSLL